MPSPAVGFLRTQIIETGTTDRLRNRRESIKIKPGIGLLQSLRVYPPQSVQLLFSPFVHWWLDHNLDPFCRSWRRDPSEGNWSLADKLSLFKLLFEDASSHLCFGILAVALGNYLRIFWCPPLPSLSGLTCKTLKLALTRLAWIAQPNQQLVTN